NVHGGAIDPLDAIADVVDAHRKRVQEDAVWLHIDGAFGLWAAASPELCVQVAAAERADSWGTDAHKWLNVPYDCGIAITAHREDHRRAIGIQAAYLPTHEHSRVRVPFEVTPALSRRARGFALYAALRELGRRGVSDLVNRSCRHARRFAEVLGAVEGVEVMNDVRLNQL